MRRRLFSRSWDLLPARASIDVGAAAALIGGLVNARRYLGRGPQLSLCHLIPGESSCPRLGVESGLGNQLRGCIWG